jgi:hypothetical protein
MKRIATLTTMSLLFLTVSVLADQPKVTSTVTKEVSPTVTKEVSPTVAKKTSPTVGRKVHAIDVHINSVRVQASCGEPATFTVQVQNNLNKVARLGTVFVGSANSPGNHAGNPTADFRDLAPGQRVTLTLPSSWNVSCEVKQGQSECFEVGIAMEPDNTANGEVWDQVWHRVCAQIPKAGQLKGTVPFNDTTFTR